jgi:hypothetical protein
MEFVTIHDLSRELNVPARVIRYRHRFTHFVDHGAIPEILRRIKTGGGQAAASFWSFHNSSIFRPSWFSAAACPPPVLIHLKSTMEKNAF